MKSFSCVDILICLILIICIALSNAELEQTKNRRGGGGTSGLYAFPRVGRSDPSLNSNTLHNADVAAAENAAAAAAAALDVLYPSATIDEYDEYPKTDAKRAGLIVYPRIGRSDAEVRRWARLLALQQTLDKRAGPSATTGVWFGPRLGKRSVNNQQFGQKEQY